MYRWVWLQTLRFEVLVDAFVLLALAAVFHGRVMVVVLDDFFISVLELPNHSCDFPADASFGLLTGCLRPLERLDRAGPVCALRFVGSGWVLFFAI